MNVVSQTPDSTSKNFRIPPDVWLVGVDLWIAIALLWGSPRRYNGSIFLIATDVMPIRLWGLLMLLLALTLLSAVIMDSLHSIMQIQTSTARFWVTKFVHVLGPAAYAGWTASYFMAGLGSDRISFFVVPLCAFMAYRHTFAPVIVSKGSVAK